MLPSKLVKGFLEELKQGKLTLYCYKKEYYTSIIGIDVMGLVGVSAKGKTGEKEKFYIASDGNIHRIRKLNYIEKMNELIKDNGSLKFYILQKFLDFDDLETIIEIYNNQ